MKSLLLSEYNHLEIADLPVPAAGPGEVLVRVEACGICGSDVHGYDGSSGRRIPPIVMGHEAAGTVEAVGRGREEATEGRSRHFRFDGLLRRVRVLQARPDQPVRQPPGDRRLLRRLPAAWRVCRVCCRAASASCIRCRRRSSFDEAAMLEAVSVALHAVRVSQAAGGETALVIGAGMIGLLTLQAARAAGCARVFIADVDATRLELARQVGRRRGTALLRRGTGGRSAAADQRPRRRSGI